MISLLSNRIKTKLKLGGRLKLFIRERSAVLVKNSFTRINTYKYKQRKDILLLRSNKEIIISEFYSLYGCKQIHGTLGTSYLRSLFTKEYSHAFSED